MRIVLVTSIDRGGPIEQALLLARGLARMGASVLVTCANGELADRFASDGVRAEVAPLRHQADVLGAARVSRLARGADVVHAHDRRSGLWTRIGPRPSRGGVRVYTTHGLPEPYLPPPAGPERPGLRATLLYRGLDAALSARCDAIVVPSQAIADALIERVGYPRRKIVVVPNGIEPPASARPAGELVGTLSLLEPVKGLEVFVRAAAQLAERHPSWRFVAYGSGSQAEPLKKLAEELGLGERMSWPGFVPASEALQTLAVFVICSYVENAPLALLEAMASGVPVIATSVGGIPEIVDERVARMIPPGDPHALANAIDQTRADGAETALRSQAARRRVEERFTAERNARTISELYARLLAARGRRTA
ncbi:MAG TPA: glycosyltransferase family 4 protein [Solirubrobacteraceae bacterium]|nr:glycosyltransferase family 4 protein [Solirubrobacteraceae bacterium]